MLKHVIEAQQFDREFLAKIFKVADIIKQHKKLFGEGNPFFTEKYPPLLKGHLMFSLFYEPSTRTRFSFEAAMRLLGGSAVSTENARAYSSVTKGETLEDTILTLAAMDASVIVLRHNEVGAAARAAAVSPIPIINAGDGVGQHPTQALLDLYTITKDFPEVDGLSVAFVGDLFNGRTVHSLIYLLAKYDVRQLFFVAPEIMQIKPEIKEYIARKGITFHQTEDLKEVISEADVVYMTRLQKERLPHRFAVVEDAAGYEVFKEFADAYAKNVIDLPMMKRMRREAILMHPFPRGKEISTEVDQDPRVRYFNQIENGLYVRMSLLKHLIIDT